jgi:hypothetical protein
MRENSQGEFLLERDSLIMWSILGTGTLVFLLALLP